MGAIDKRATAVIGDVAPSTDAMWRWCRAVALLINWQHNKVLLLPKLLLSSPLSLLVRL